VCNEKYVSVFLYIQQDVTLHSLFSLETALHVSGGTTTHYQERKQLYLRHLLFVTHLLLPAAIAVLPAAIAVAVLIYFQQDATIHSLFYLETALHVSGVTTTHHQERKQLSIASGICHTVTATCRYRGRVGTAFQLFHDAVHTVVCAPDNGWWYHPKHVEQFPDKVASCWTYIRIQSI
jgi:hypothetical protein